MSPKTTSSLPDAAPLRADLLRPRPVMPMIAPRHITLLLLAALAPSACGDGAPEPDATSLPHGATVRTSHEALRLERVMPAGWETPRHADSANVRVWWVEEGEDAPPRDDDDQSGVPDRVELVLERAEAVLVLLQQSGWRLPLRDAALDPEHPEAQGGDARFDIYLKHFEAGDGQFLTGPCRPSEAAPLTSQCAGYLYLENDFLPLSSAYDSPEQAVSVVISHELFHVVQAAYTSELPGWFSEGSATWFEERFDPSQRDFESLASRYFIEPERALDDVQRGPVDGFAYGAALFFHSLDLRFGDGVVQHALSQLAAGASPVQALDEALIMNHRSLVEAFALFARDNLFTGSLARDGFGYPMAAVWPGVPGQTLPPDRQLDWNARVAPLAARYALLTPAQPTRLTLAEAEGWPLAHLELVWLDDPAPTPSFLTLSPDAPALLEPGRRYALLLTAASLEEEHAMTLRVRHVRPETPGMPDMGQSPDMALPDVEPDMEGAIDMGQALDMADDSVDMGPVPHTDPPVPQEGCAQGGAFSPAHGLPPVIFLFFLGAFLAWRARRLDDLSKRTL